MRIRETKPHAQAKDPCILIRCRLFQPLISPHFDDNKPYPRRILIFNLKTQSTLVRSNHEILFRKSR
jgi:hypothetical protein